MKPNISLRASESFNPPAAGGSKEAAFDSNGELNAYNNKDVITQLSNVLAHLSASKEGPAVRFARHASAAERGEYFSALHEALQQGDEGMRIVGQELLNPIREILDYEGFARKVLAPREVGPGEIPRYDRDAYITAWVIGRDGITPESRVQGRYFYPNEFLVTARPTVEIQDIYQMQYDVLARSQDRARQAVEYQEDRACINLLDAAATTVNDITYGVGFTWDVLMDLKWQVEKNRLPCDKMLVNLSETRSLFKSINSSTGGYHFDPVTNRELILQGYLGNILGIQLIASAGNGLFEPVPMGTIYAVSRPEYLGGMPIRVPLQSEPINEFLLGNAVKGWFFFEMISEVVLNPRGVAKAVIS